MNQEIRYEGSNITNKVIRYNRTQSICSGIGILDIVAIQDAVNGEPWDQVILYEDGKKKGEYNVISLSNSVPDGTLTIHCQDNSIRLIDTFIVESYTIDYVSYARYWIEKFLTEAGVSYTFTTSDNGSPISKNTVLGLNSAYDIIVTLLQQSGWYIYFDKNGNAIVGSLVAGTGTKLTVNDNQILDIVVNKNDEKLRNRAVVWGSANPFDNSWVFADVYRSSPYEIDSNDKRTVVLANSSVDSTYFANILANKMLDEFDRIDTIITAQIAGYKDVDLGDKVVVKSKSYHGTALVTTLSSTASAKGATTTIVLNERCPRLFGFISYGSDYVYIGTSANGIWRRFLTGGIWEDYSTGLPSGASISDLKINNGALATVADGLLYVRYEGDATWYYVDPGSAPDGVSLTDNGVCKGCTINRNSNEIASIWEYNNKVYTVRVIGYTTTTVLPVLIEDLTDLVANDIDTDDNNIYVALSSPVSGTIYDPDLGPFQDEAFTTRDLDNFTREFGMDYYSRGSYVSDICWDDGRAYFIKKVIDTGNYQFYGYKFSGSDIIENISPEFSLPSVPKYLVLNRNIPGEVYFICGLSVYSYNAFAHSLTYRYSASTTYTQRYKNILYTATYSATSTSATFSVAYFDILTGSSVNLPNIHTANADEIKVYQVATGRIKDKAVFAFVFSAKNNTAGDNCVTGVNGVGHSVYTVCGYIGTSGGFDYTIKTLNTSVGTHTKIKSYLAIEHVQNPYISVAVGTYGGSGYLYFQVVIIDYGPWLPGGGYPCTWRLPTTPIAEDVFLGNISIGDWSISYGPSANIDRGLQYDPSSGNYVLGSYGYLTNGPLYWKPREDGLIGSTSSYYFKDLLGNNQTLGISSTRSTEDGILKYYDYATNKVYTVGAAGAFPNRYAALGRYSFSSGTLEIAIELDSLSNTVDNTHCNGYIENAYLGGASQNVLAIRYSFCDYPVGAGGDYYRFYQFGDLTDISGSINVTAVETLPKYTVIDANYLPHRLESSTPGILISYPVQESGQPSYNENLSVLFTSGNIPTLYSGSTISGTVTSGWLRLPAGIDNSIIYDARHFRYGYGEAVVFSGATISGLGDGHVGVGINTNLSAITDILTGDWTVLESNSEKIYRIETSRVIGDPYFFYSTYVSSGVMGSGITSSGGLFYQRLTGYGSFMDVSSGLPNDLITVIRIDDRI